MLAVSSSTSTNTGLCAEEHDHLRGRDEGERRRDDLVAGLDPECHQRDQQRFGPRGDGHAMPGAGIRLELLLQLAHFRPHDVLAVIEHALDPRIDAVLELSVLRFQVDEVH
jgi:hypothetical protein